MNFLRLVALSAALLMSAAGVIAARESVIPGQDGKPGYLVRRWSSADGLPQNKIQCVYQSRDGYIWAGTQHGLARFDGVRFTVMGARLVPPGSLPAVNAITEDKSDGSLWAATTAGLFRYKENELIHYTSADGLPHSKVWKLLLDSEGGLWMETESFMARLVNSQFTPITPAYGLPETRPDWMVKSPDGRVWLGKQGWRRQWDPKIERFVELPLPGLPDDLPITCVQFSRSGEMLIGTDQGLYRGKDGHWTHYGTTNGLGDAFIHFVLEDSTGQVWLGTKESGFHRLIGNRFVPVSLGVTATEWAVDTMFEDREGNLWIGAREGLFELVRQQVTTYTTANGLVDDRVQCINQGADGKMWIGSDFGVSWMRGTNVARYRRPFPASQNGFKAVLVDRAGTVWASGYGLFQLREGEFVDVNLEMKFGPRMLQSIFQDRADALWVGTAEGVARIQGTNTDWVTVLDGLGSNGGDVIVEDRQNAMWIGNNAGLHRLQDGKVTRFTTKDGLVSDHVRAIHEDNSGVLWIGTEGGLSRYVPGGAGIPAGHGLPSQNAGKDAGAPKFFAFTSAHGMPENLVNALLEDEFGFFGSVA